MLEVADNGWSKIEGVSRSELIDSTVLKFYYSGILKIIWEMSKIEEWVDQKQKFQLIKNLKEWVDFRIDWTVLASEILVECLP